MLRDAGVGCGCARRAGEWVHRERLLAFFSFASARSFARSVSSPPRRFRFLLMIDGAQTAFQIDRRLRTWGRRVIRVLSTFEVRPLSTVTTARHDLVRHTISTLMRCTQQTSRRGSCTKQ